MDQRLGVIKGDMTSSYEITLETFTIPSPHVALLYSTLDYEEDTIKKKIILIQIW